jgi:hypothetical protein
MYVAALAMILIVGQPAAAQETQLPDTRSLWDVEQPLYEQLLTDAPPPMAADGALVWAHLVNSAALRPLAARHGWHYRLDEWLAEHASRQWHLLTSPPVFVPVPSVERSDWHARHGLTYAYYCFYYDRLAKEKYPFVLDPEFTEAKLAQLEEALQTCPEMIWGVFAGDEQIPRALKAIPKLMAEDPENYPHIAVVAEEIRRDFGFGAWGPPESPDDRNPFRWSAMYRWVLAEFRERQGRLAEIVRRYKPDAPLISTDPTSAVHPYEFSLTGADVDIITNQMQPWDNNSRMIRYALAAKMIADLSGKDFWPCPHLNRITNGISPTADGAREVYSILALNGATGFHLYLRDCYGRTDKAIETYAPPWGDPERWRQMTGVHDRVLAGELPARPEPDCALYYSNDAHQAMRATAAYPCQHAYAALGPILGAWFQVVDEHTFTDPAAVVAKYRAVFLPTAQYLRKDAVDRLEQFVEAGGTLALADPRAFDFHLDGTDTSARREVLTGANLGDVVEATTCEVVANSLLPDAAGTVIQLRGEALALEVTDAEVIARYPSGAAAITVAERGEGRCVYFGFNVFPTKPEGPGWRWLDEEIVLDEGWRGFWREVCAALEIQTGRDIWRFRYPAPEPLPEPTEVCLTGNAVQWVMEQPRFERNRELAGSYSYSIPPDLIPDAAERDIAFTAGNLTDRRDAARVEATEEVEPYVVAWQTTEAVDVTFNLGGEERVSRVRLFVSGHLPATALSSSADGETWTAASTCDPVDAGEDVVLVELSGPTDACRHLKLAIAARPDETTLTICEVDLWGPKD